MLMRRRHGAVLVRTGDGAVWIGHLRALDDPRNAGLKLPATSVLIGHLSDVPEGTDGTGYREIGYRRDAAVAAMGFAAPARDQIGGAEAEVLAQPFAADRARSHRDRWATASGSRDRPRQAARILAPGETDERLLAPELYDDVDTGGRREDVLAGERGDVTADDDRPRITALAQHAGEREPGEQALRGLQRHAAHARAQ